MIDPPPLIGPATPLRRVERSSRDREPGGQQGGHEPEKRKDEHDAEQEGGDGVHIDIRV